jgi:hypothetical protein
MQGGAHRAQRPSSEGAQLILLEKWAREGSPATFYRIQNTLPPLLDVFQQAELAHYGAFICR